MKKILSLTLLVAIVWAQSNKTVSDDENEIDDIDAAERKKMEEEIRRQAYRGKPKEKTNATVTELPPFFWSFIGFQPLSEVIELNQRFPTALIAYLTHVCQDRLPSEYFRYEELTLDNCNTVGTCHLTRGTYALISQTCESGQLYDVDAQECRDENEVKNCQEPFARFVENKAKDQPSVRCDEKVCKSPDCYCSPSGFDIPGGLDVLDTPQFININFEGSSGNQEIEAFGNIFKPERKNPNGCSIKGTWYIANKYSNYISIEQMRNYGHEIATMGITREDSSLYWTNPAPSTYFNEFVTSRDWIEKYAMVPGEEVVGTRVPYLYLGGEKQFQMMEKNGFLYDSTVVVQQIDHIKQPTWPYNVKFGMPHECHSLFDSNCPNFDTKYDVWEMPLNEFKGFSNANCPTLSNCKIRDEDHFKLILQKQFLRHFYTNRAPIQISMQAGFFRVNHHLNLMATLIDFIEEKLENHPEVYFATNKQILEWINNPVSLEEIKNFEPLKGRTCEGRNRIQVSCSRNNPCKFPTNFNHRPEIIYMQTCNRQCPRFYPWIGNDLGNKPINYN